MHETMTRATQPRHAIQHPLIMPPLLEHLTMHAARDEMVITQRDPVPLADLACVPACIGPCWRRGCDGGDVLVEHRPQEVCEGGFVWD